MNHPHHLHLHLRLPIIDDDDENDLVLDAAQFATPEGEEKNSAK